MTATPQPGAAQPSGSTQPRTGGAQPATRLLAPERPKLAPNIKLMGQMQGSAFVDPPWLLEREDQGYVQVTELLYRVAERCDGQHTAEEIAQSITQAGTPVNPATIQGLIAQMLVPRGLVQTADGQVAEVSRSGPSPLSVNLRMKVLPASLIEPVTAFLQHLYWPPVLVAILGIGLVAYGWLFGVHGVGESLRTVMYQPASMFLVLGAILLSAGFHEFGHASALRYGGGRVKTMGAGFYLLYPAFYTDVSDAYRLPKGARLRTDLGGFYFNLIFGLAVMAIALATGSEVLLLVSAIAVIEVFYQLMPFLRLDGYWALADLTGIPDFFSQMTAFWRSILPIPGWRGQKLQELKWWGKAVFVVYTLVTLPLLAFFFFLLVKGLPRLLATGWDSLGQQVHSFQAASASQDWLATAAAVTQILILALITLGPAWVLTKAIAGGMRRLWTWGNTTPAKRAVAGLATAGIATAFTLLWLPELPNLMPSGTQSADRAGATTAAGGASGQLSAPARYRPIAPGERFTVLELFTDPSPAQQEPAADGSTDAPIIIDTAQTAPQQATPAGQSPVGTAAATPQPASSSTSAGLAPTVAPTSPTVASPSPTSPAAATAPAVVSPSVVARTATPAAVAPAVASPVVTAPSLPPTAASTPTAPAAAASPAAVTPVATSAVAP